MNRIRSFTMTFSACALGALALAPAALAGGYPPPDDPGTLSTYKSKTVSLTVSKSCASSALNKTCFPTIQAAVNKSRQTTHAAEYKITISPGTYNEFVLIEGHQFDGLTLQGSTSNPLDVKIDLTGLSKTANSDGIVPKENAIIVNGTSGVTIKNLSVSHYDGNGLWFVNIGELFGPSSSKKSYTIDNVVARYGGVYGIFARNSIGGSITNSEAYYNNDSGFYIGETPPQSSPKRTTISGVKSWGNELGYSGTNSRYVDIKNSKWFNNGIGIVPNMLLSEDFPPPSFNTYTNNDIYGNNFNYFKGAPFQVNKGSLGGADYPPGIGILLFGSQDSVVSGNRIWGNKLVGAGMLSPQVLLQELSSWKKICDSSKVTYSKASCDALVSATVLTRNKVFGNAFGRSGLNQNGRDIFWANDGLGNCIGGAGSNANTVGGAQALLTTYGDNRFDGKGPWQTCDGYTTKFTDPKTGKKITKAQVLNGPMDIWYFNVLTFTDASNKSGADGMGAMDVIGSDFVDNTGHDGRWAHTGDQAAWPAGFGTPLEVCKVTAPYEGCDGQTGGKP